jgi:hypothetical protein
VLAYRKSDNHNLYTNPLTSIGRNKKEQRILSTPAAVEPAIEKFKGSNPGQDLNSINIAHDIP